MKTSPEKPLAKKHAQISLKKKNSWIGDCCSYCGHELVYVPKYSNVFSKERIPKRLVCPYCMSRKLEAFQDFATDHSSGLL